MTTVVIVLAIIAVIAAVVYFTVGRTAERAATHDGGPPSTSEQFFSDKNDRPGSPGAEAMGVAGDGQLVAGPSDDAGGRGGPANPSDNPRRSS